MPFRARWARFIRASHNQRTQWECKARAAYSRLVASTDPVSVALCWDAARMNPLWVRRYGTPRVMPKTHVPKFFSWGDK